MPTGDAMFAMTGALTCAGLAAAVGSGPPTARQRLRRLAPQSMSPEINERRAAEVGSSRGSRALAATLAGLAVALLAGAPAGVVLGPVAGLLAWRWLARLPARSRLREIAEVQRDLPLVVDLIAAALAAGAPLELAVEVVGESAGGPLGARLRGVAAATRLGASGQSAWASLSDDPECARVGRALVSAASHGGSPLPRLTALADEARTRARWAGQSRARAVGARAAAPLGLCFLPAFVLLGIVPLVVGAAETVF